MNGNRISQWECIPCLLLLLTLFSSASQATIWRGYIDHPSWEEAETIENVYLNCKNVGCNQALFPDETEVGKLLDMIKIGSESSTRLGFLLLKENPSMTPQVQSSLGEALTRSPRVVLGEAVRRDISLHQLESIATAFPESINGKPVAKLRAIDNRISVLQNIDNPNFWMARHRMLMALMGSRMEVEEILKKELELEN
ncbi:MAG TPA: hypothetical protein DCZ03_15890 [Gammaproteobacteria bacterium]|nr:hypothetical protein [Gammaproteobacteria bacterium]